MIAATSAGAAAAFAAEHGIETSLLIDRGELLVSPLRLRRCMSAAEGSCAAIHSVDWARERAPQLAELALAITPSSQRFLIDEASESIKPFRRQRTLGTIARLPFELAEAGFDLGAGAVRALHRSRPPLPPDSLEPPRGVVAIWPGASSDVGGAVTHMSGILAAFRRAGIRVGLASAGPVADQLAAAVDEVEVVQPLGRGRRLSADTERIALDRGLLTAARRVAARTDADFVYQRHRAFLDAGSRLCSSLGVPFVLEWNASEVWMRDNWDRPKIRLGPIERLVAASERRSLRAATLVAAISANAATMALEAGAAPEKVEVIPNGVDIERIDAALLEARPGARNGGLVGWIGSFGPWHGASVLVRAVAVARSDVTLRMIGDGRERPAVERLASELGVASRIEWTGALPHEEALARLAECDVLVAPHVPASATPFFGSPTKLFEYMALGRPIVASRLAQLGEVLEDGRTALLVRPGDERELGEALSRLLEMPDRGASLAREAAAAARQEHSWDRRAAQILAAISRRRREPG